MAGSSAQAKAKAKKEVVALDEKIPWMKDMTTKLINIGARTCDRENLEANFVEFFEEFIGLFEKNIMTRYRKSKRVNRRTRLATYLHDMITKLNLLSMLLEKETKKRMVKYFGRLFKMYIELISQSSMPKRLGSECMVLNIGALAKNLFYKDVDVILDVYIVAIIPQEFKNSLMLNVLSESSYFSTTCASFYKYLVVAKTLKEAPSVDKSTINEIDNILSNSRIIIPKGFERYLKSRVSVPNLPNSSSSSMDLVKILQKIDWEGASQECLHRFYIDVVDFEMELLDDTDDFSSTAGAGFFLDKSPDSNLTQEVIEAAPEANNDNEDEEVINLQPLFCTIISSDKNEMAENVPEDCKQTSCEIKVENVEGSESPGLEIIGEKASTPTDDRDDDEESFNSELSNIPNYDTTDTDTEESFEEDVNKSGDETLNKENVEESKVGESDEEEDEEDSGEEEEEEEETTIEDLESSNHETTEDAEKSLEEVNKSVDGTINEENVEEPTGVNSDEDGSGSIEEESTMEVSEDAEIKKDVKITIKNKENKSGDESNKMETKLAATKRNKKEENVKQGTSQVTIYQLRSKKIATNNNTATIPKRVAKRKLDDLKDNGHVAEVEKPKMNTRANTVAAAAYMKKPPIDPKVKVVEPKKIKTPPAKAKLVHLPKNKSPINSKAKQAQPKISPILNKGTKAGKTTQNELEKSGRIMTRSKTKTKVPASSS